MPLFHKIVADSALDAGRDAKIMKFLHQAEDHPVATAFPEGEYLKGLVCISRLEERPELISLGSLTFQ